MRHIFIIILDQQCYGREKLEHKHALILEILFFIYMINDAEVNEIKSYIKNTLPVVNAGVHSCSPVAPHRRVKLLDGSTVTSGPAAECNVEILRFPIKYEYYTIAK